MPDGSIEIAPALTDEQSRASWNEWRQGGNGGGTGLSSPGTHVAGAFGMSAAQLANSVSTFNLVPEGYVNEEHFVTVAVRDMIGEALKLPDHLEVLRDKLAAGQIVGTHYWSDDLQAGCFYGTMTMAAWRRPRGPNGATTGGLRFRANSGSPREQLFSRIGYGANPSNNRFARAAYEGVLEAIKIRDNILARAQKPASPPVVSKRLPWYRRALA